MSEEPGLLPWVWRACHDWGWDVYRWTPLPLPRGTPSPLPLPRGTPSPLPLPRGTPSPLPLPRGTPSPLPLPRGTKFIQFHHSLLLLRVLYTE